MPFLQSRTSVLGHMNTQTMYNFYTSFLSLRTLPIPIISAVNGPAIGAGACVTLATDYRLCTPETIMGFNFTKLGIHPGMGGSHYLPRLIGPGKAAGMLVGGGKYKGGELKDLGVIDRVLDEVRVRGGRKATRAVAGNGFRAGAFS